MEIHLVEEMLASSASKHILTASNVFSRNLFATAVGQVSTRATAYVRPQVIAQHAYVPKHKLTDKSSETTAQVMKERLK